MGGEIIEFPTMKKLKEAVKEAAREARLQGVAEGEARGEAKGEARGLLMGALHTLYGLVLKNIITLSQAASRAKMPEDEFSAGLAEYKKAIASA